MRKRSYTIEADTIDEYIQAATKTSSYLVPFHPSPSRPSLPSNQNLNPNNTEAPKPSKIRKSPSSRPKPRPPQTNSLQNQDSDPENELDKAPQDSKSKLRQRSVAYWQGFDFDGDDFSHNKNEAQPDNNSEIEAENLASRLPSMLLSENTADTDSSEDCDGNGRRPSKKTVIRRIMVIGQNGAGKHSLINGVFECENPGLKTAGQVMDLLSKTEEANSSGDEENNEVKYQFWLHNLPALEEGNEGECEALERRFEELVKLYYRRVELFVFMYSIADKKSFACLDRAVQKVLEEVPAEKFTGVLLGAKSDLEGNREVPFFDGIALQEKHKLTFFVETSLGDRGLKSKLVQLLQELEEGTGEMMARKGHSILSIE